MENEIKAIIFDIDGVLTYQGRVCPGAVETVAAVRRRNITVRFLTNSTLKSRASCAEKLRRAGFECSAAEVVTASYAAAVYLQRIKPKSCWVMLGGEGLEEFREFRHDENDPEYIVVGDYRDKFTFGTLNKALRNLMKGARLIVMIPELTDTSLGDVELNVGSWGHMLERASGRNATYLGKPDPFVFDLTLSGMQTPKENVCMIGDSVSTDILGARNAGIRSVLLKTGEFSHDIHLLDTIQPDWIFDSIREISALVDPFPC